jgi:hypothetical protein
MGHLISRFAFSLRVAYKVMKRQLKAGSRDVHQNDSRFLAEVEILLQKLDEAELDGYMRPSAFLDGNSKTGERDERSREKKDDYLNCLEHCAKSSDGKVLASLWGIWGDV